MTHTQINSLYPAGESNPSVKAVTTQEKTRRLYLSNEELEIVLDGCRKNIRNAQKVLYYSYYRYAMSIALRYASSDENAVEMTNDAFMKIYKDLKNFVTKTGKSVVMFNGWLKRLTVNACIDHIRKYSKKEMNGKVEAGLVILSDKSETAEQKLYYNEILACLQQLSPAYRAVFNLYVMEGFSHAEIAEKLNISENTSKSNLHKARHNLQQLVKKSNRVTGENQMIA
jgi:RNA polymerase sigma-70 factor (ECF subfamily)